MNEAVSSQNQGAQTAKNHLTDYKETWEVNIGKYTTCGTQETNKSSENARFQK
jgi:hypothetical protein